MDVNHSLWEQFEGRFMALAERATLVQRADPPLDRCRYYLCLYGENGMSAEDEMAFLSSLEKENLQGLQKLEVDSNYWQDVVLFLP